MKKPTLRLRQVFEGPTHFKVVRPLGNPIKIAKKGLSPNLMGRLRKFARDGEVPEATEQDEQNAQDLMDELVQPATRGQAVDPVAASQALDVGEVMPPVGVPVEVVRSGDVAQTPIEALPEPERIKAISQMGPTLPRITEPEPLAPMKPSPAIEEEAVKTEIESALVDKSLAQIRTLIEKEMGKDDPDYKKLGSLAETYERLNKPIETPAAPVAVATAPKAPAVAPAAVVAPAAATVAAPTAPVAPEPAVAVAPTAAPAAPVAPIARVAPPTAVKPEVTIPKGLDVTKPLDVSALREYRKANPGVPDSELVLNLIKQYTPDVPANIQIADLDVQPPEGAGKDTLAEFDKAKEQLVKATVDQARVDLESSRAILEANQRAQAQRLLNAEKDRETADALVSRRDALRAAVEGGFKPESLYGSNNLAGQIGSALSIALGAFASGMTGIPNYALKIYNDAIERDLYIQKSKYNSLVNQYNRLLGDTADAEKLARADLNDLAALQLEGIKTSSTIKGIGPATERMVAEIRAKAAKEREEVAIKQSQAREADVEARLAEEVARNNMAYKDAMGDSARARAAVAGIRKGISADRLEFAKVKWIEGRKLSVPDPSNPSKSIFILAPTEGVAKEKAGEITQRVTGLMQLEDFEDWLKSNANKPVTPEAIKEMQVKVAGIVENYPGTVRGSKNLVTVAQSKLLKPAITSTSIPIIQFMDVLGLTSTAMKEIRADANRGVLLSVRGAASEGDPGLAEFTSKFTARGYGGRGPYGGGGEPEKTVRIRLKNKSEIEIPAKNLEAAKQRLGKMFDAVVP